MIPNVAILPCPFIFHIHTCDLMSQPLRLLPGRPDGRQQLLPLRLELLPLSIVEGQVLRMSGGRGNGEADT